MPCGECVCVGRITPDVIRQCFLVATWGEGHSCRKGTEEKVTERSGTWINKKKKRQRRRRHRSNLVEPCRSALKQTERKQKSVSVSDSRQTQSQFILPRQNSRRLQKGEFRFWENLHLVWCPILSHLMRNVNFILLFSWIDSRRLLFILFVPPIAARHLNIFLLLLWKCKLPTQCDAWSHVTAPRGQKVPWRRQFTVTFNRYTCDFFFFSFQNSVCSVWWRFQSLVGLKNTFFFCCFFNFQDPPDSSCSWK